jgi:hypothetical protein
VTPRRACSIAVVAALACAPVGCTLLTSLDGLRDGVAGAAQDGSAAIDGGADAPSFADSSAGVDGSRGDADAAAISRYAAAVLADGPLLYYRFGEKSGAPAKDEVSGTTTPYPLTGITYGTPGNLAGDPDTAVTTDGSGSLDVTQGAAEFDGVQAFSVEAWVSASPTGSDIGFLVDHETWSGARGGWTLRVSKNDVGFERWAGATPTSNSVADALAAVTGEWHHIVATYDGGTERLYVDGVRIATGAASLSLAKLGGPFAIGKQNCVCSGNGFVGAFDELAIYSKALAEDRILAHLGAAR